MSQKETSSDLHQRLDDLEKRLAENEAEIKRTGFVPPHHREQIDRIAAEAGAMGRKILGAKQSTWGTMKRELDADWNTLSHSFELWVQHVDKDNGDRES